MSKEVYTREALLELRRKVVQGNRTKYIESVVTYVKDGVINTVTDTRSCVFEYTAPCSSKGMAEILMPEIRAQLKEIFPDLAVRVEFPEPRSRWFCKVFAWLFIPCIKVTVSWA